MLLFFPLFASLPAAATAQARTATCPNLTRNLSFGSRGQDVTNLQLFLTAQNLLAAGNSTGYFGRLTQAAVKKFQCARNIVCTGTPRTTGWGTVGLRTRAAIVASCSASPPVQPAPPLSAPNTISPTPPIPSSCTPLSSQTQTLTCPTGQTGSITQTRTSSCPGPGWGDWATTASTCAVAADNSIKNVKDFGALCDAVENPSNVNGGAATGHDDFPSFATAIAALPASGGIVTVPQFGTGKCLWKLQAGANPSLKLPSNVTLQMGDGVRILVEGTSNGVNGYTNGAIINANMSTGGNYNINVLGGEFKAAGPNFGSVFVAFKHLSGGKIHTTFLDNNGSARAQVAYSNNVDVRIAVRYEGGPWMKVVQPGSGGNMWAFEDGFRIGSGSWNIHVEGDIHSGDDSIALNNEWSETNSSNIGADIHNITIGPVTATSQAGNTLRIYQQAQMTAGRTHDVFIANLNGTPLSSGSGATGISVADYSNRRAITDINFTKTSLNVSGVSGVNVAGVSLVNTDRVKFTGLTLSGANGYGVAVADGRNSEFHSVMLSGNPGSVDGIIFGPYSPTLSGGSDNSIVDGGTITGFGRDKVRIEGSVGVVVSGI